MIATLKGILTYLEPSSCIIECGGVGFQCFISGKALGSLGNIGSEVKLFTYMSVKEDAIDLYGFADMEEMNCFKLITSVSGVGPKIGLAILTAFSPEQISFAIANNDPKYLTAATGVGLKLAQRIILELKDKVSALPSSSDTTVSSAVINNSNSGEAIAALTALGFSHSEASVVVGKLQSDLPVDSLIKEALKLLSRQV
ncbi:MAG: Holliday junction branch migration protein RuvA [Acutalibacteraceae bacterium]|nr:Holliday junction branch migration protein RuvA [Acutalibacteraceae bacterium]